MLQEDMKRKQIRIHPNEKPKALYTWIFKNYCNDMDTILDTHGGSARSAIAAHELGFTMTIIENDKHYFDLGLNEFRIYERNASDIEIHGFAKTELSKANPILF